MKGSVSQCVKVASARAMCTTSWMRLLTDLRKTVGRLTILISLNEETLCKRKQRQSKKEQKISRFLSRGVLSAESVSALATRSVLYATSAAKSICLKYLGDHVKIRDVSSLIRRRMMMVSLTIQSAYVADRDSYRATTLA